ncbi:kinesin motor domain-containing protein [Encephalitozoon hellem ATCC 50504]|uniref:Kinesin-like protein n=1 Tax=Encephalitozoon hellem TaxID=27973 RepID=A0A9Q9C652_ENCHE|nr:kinesin motor domain-containing protein [Encephalitozoon hellem ATCC 50504]AFM99464.1 kinesin motor domain-containing protein [Encephalitozoon hellem ATCC 50504]UTX44475.1 kinesin-like protein [Encephalitozoon hellem]WEL39976.1 kinesin-like protein [Encephalitozoon hellem]|eukprot:XP_003888445.1 kinesin motor domain-containing protein [Encephalitozoon hellem ATCC 50504]
MERAPIEAYIRVKPGKSILKHTDKSVLVLKECGEAVKYEFDGVFGPDCTQDQVFERFRCIVPRLIKGHNQTLFCYGSTGAGKTYTMVGHGRSYGLMHNLVKDVLTHGSFLVSYMEIYNEKIYDLLEPKELVLRECNGTIVIPGLFTKRIESIEEFEQMFRQGTKNRTTAETKLNKSSSRSHGILRIGVGEYKLNLIDLAGSENNRKTGNEGIRLTESNSINRSLFVLGKVVNAILKGEKRIPYRDSKLTRLLQDSLGGNSLCYIIANIVGDSSAIGDSINTLSFASKSRNIVNVLETTQKPKHENAKSNKCILPEFGGRRPLSLKTNMKFNVQREKDMPLRGRGKENNPFQEPLSIDTTGSKKRKNLLEDKRCKGEGNKCTKVSKQTSNGSSLILKSLLEKPDIVLSPRTKEKSYRAFLKRAQELESAQKYKSALEDYKTMQKFCDNDFIREKIEKISTLLKKSRKKPEITRKNVLEILNQGNFFDIKKLPRVGDKRAQAIVDFVNGGNYFETLSDLRLLFSEKIVNSILFSIGDG